MNSFKYYFPIVISKSIHDILVDIWYEYQLPYFCNGRLEQKYSFCQILIHLITSLYILRQEH